MTRRWLTRGAVTLAVTAWALGLAVGFGLLVFHDFRPGTVVTPAEQWPAETAVERGPDYTLVMLAHPYCGCMPATLGELNVLMNRLGPRVRATVLFLRPEDQPPEWSHTPTWTQAGEIPGVTVTEDLGGREHRLFRAGTSGEVVLYDRAGKLVFNGGITASRGHAGDNLGLQRIFSLVEKGSADRGAHAVYGCSLESPGAATVGIPVPLPASLLGADAPARAGRALCRSCHSHVGVDPS